MVADFLLDPNENGVGEISEVERAVLTHYDQDHLGGFAYLPGLGISFGSVYDQGSSLGRAPAPDDGSETKYEGYLDFVGDPDDNMTQGHEEDGFIRKSITVGRYWKVGNAKVKCLSVRGGAFMLSGA